MKIMVTGGCGFIGSNLVRHLIEESDHEVVNLDTLTYAGNVHSLADVSSNERYHFEQVDIRDGAELSRCFKQHSPDWVLHLAAESHVDRSIEGAEDFIGTNVLGTFQLLQAARVHYEQLDAARRDRFRFLHVSTDEVYGSLGEEGLFTESTAYDPRSPYSASKAASDHLVKAWWHTHGLPVVVTNCSNNYGPYQFPEKLIPVVILKSIGGEPIPIYGRGENVRDWLHVSDHVTAMLAVAERGRLGETYNIGGNNEMANIDLVKLLCGLLDELKPRPDGQPYADQITFVTDRPGHDLRYAIDATKIRSELGWEPSSNHQELFRETVQWYLDHGSWVDQVLDGSYQMQRLGIS